MLFDLRLRGREHIGLAVGKVLGKYKVGKHFDLVITDEHLDYWVAQERVEEEAAVDGIYVIRTSVAEE